MRWRWFLTLNGIFTISVLIMILWAGSVLGFLYSWIPNYVQGEVVTIPDLEGLPAETAKQRAVDLGLKVNYAATETRNDASQPRGYVLSHVPAPMQSVKRTRPIRFILSSGPEQSTVPDLRHKTVGQAEFELSILGLRAGMISHTHSERHATAHSIIATTPGAGTELARGERVHLLVSLGPRPVEMTMPTLTGMTLAQARKLAKEQLLYVDKVERRRAPREKADLVLAQVPPAGSRVFSGSGVTLTVNEPSARAGGASRLLIIQHTVSGGVPEDVGSAADGDSADNGEPVADGGGAENGDPSVDGDATADGEPVQEEGGDGPPLEIAPRLIRVRIMLRDDTGYRELYDEMALPGETISFPRNVVGEVTLTVYEDDMNEPIRRETL